MRKFTAAVLVVFIFSGFSVESIAGENDADFAQLNQSGSNDLGLKISEGLANKGNPSGEYEIGRLFAKQENYGLAKKWLMKAVVNPDSGYKRGDGLLAGDSLQAASMLAYIFYIVDHNYVEAYTWAKKCGTFPPAVKLINRMRDEGTIPSDLN